jgi:hypothetical protein
LTQPAKGLTSKFGIGSIALDILSSHSINLHGKKIVERTSLAASAVQDRGKNALGAFLMQGGM